MCKNVRELIKDGWVRGGDEWREGKIGEELSSRLLAGGPGTCTM